MWCLCPKSPVSRADNPHLHLQNAVIGVIDVEPANVIAQPAGRIRLALVPINKAIKVQIELSSDFVQTRTFEVKQVCHCKTAAKCRS